MTAAMYQAKHLGLYTLTRAPGYLVMLIAMTYSVELFLAVLVGLTVGHWLFNLDVAAGEDLTACCQTLGNNPRIRKDEEEAKPPQTSNLELPELPDNGLPIS